MKMTFDSEASPFGGEVPPVAVDAAREPGRALIHLPVNNGRTGFAFRPKHGWWAAGLMLAIGAGAGSLEVAHYSSAEAVRAETQVRADATAQVLHKLEDEVGRLKGSVDTMRASAESSRQDESLRGLKKSVDNLKQEVEQVRSTSGATLTQLSTKIDKTDHDPSAKLAEIMARLDKLDRDPKDKPADDNGAKVNELANRLSRLEKQIAAPAATGSIPPAPKAAPIAVAPPAPTPPQRPATKPEAALTPATGTSVVAEAAPRPADARQPTIDGWAVRDVYDGMALVEGRNVGLREIAPGEYLPGLGEIRSIERRGRAWVVLTSRGVVE